jgi:hypothetical protein
MNTGQCEVFGITLVRKDIEKNYYLIYDSIQAF